MITENTLRHGLRRTAVGALAAIALAVGLAAPASSSAASTTNVDITALPDGFLGYVHSENPACEVPRDVVLYKVKAKKRGKEKLKFAGAATTELDTLGGIYGIPATAPGTYQVEVIATPECASATSGRVLAI